MTKRVKLYLFLIALTILGIVALEYSKPEKVNWFPSYASHHKIPFGTFVMHEQLKRMASPKNIKDVDRPPYEFLNANTIEGTYVFINDDISFDDAELDELLNWTAKGNTLFVASQDFESNILDTLNLKTKSFTGINNFDSDYLFQLKNKNLDTSVVQFDRANYLYHFNEIDTLKTSIISVTDNINTTLKIKKNYANTIKQAFGEGEIILSTIPQAFTNYFILNSPNQNYTAGLLSYINTSKPIYIDNHYKTGKTFYSSPLYIFLNTKELKWAYYIMLIGVILYIIFEGKRKQRAIPIVKPLRNQTVDYTRTIANIYYEKGQHNDIAQHKIQHFLDYIRTKYYLNSSNFDEDYLKNLAARSNNSIEDTIKLFSIIKNYRTNKTVNNIQLEQLNSLIELFKKNNT